MHDSHGHGPLQALKKRLSFSHSLHKKVAVRRAKHKEAEAHLHAAANNIAENDDHPRKDPASQSLASSAQSLASTTSVAASATSTTASSSLPPTREKYCTLRLSEDLSISIGDAFEPNPTSTLQDAQVFEYGPIRWPKFIRLLLVFPAFSPGEPLETIVFHADLHEVPFKMLKYEAGDSTSTMHLNGMKKTIQRGLYDALLAVRDRSKNRAFTIIWVDEVCVNQNDPRERDAHARLKRDIVAACTGKTAVDSALNANFKRGRPSRRSLEADSSTASASGEPPRHSTYQRARQTIRHLSNASELSGSTTDGLSRGQSRAQSIGASSVMTTERIGPESDTSSPSEGEGDSSSEDSEYEGDPKGKGRAKSIRRRRDQSAHSSHLEDERERELEEREEEREERERVRERRRDRDRERDKEDRPRTSISFDLPKHPRNDNTEEDKTEEKAVDKENAKPYVVMKSRPL